MNRILKRQGNYHRFHVTFFAFDVIKDTLNKVAAVFKIMQFRDHKVGSFRIYRVRRVNIVSDLTGTVNSILVVTTKENIKPVSLDVPISRYLPHA